MGFAVPTGLMFMCRTVVVGLFMPAGCVRLLRATSAVPVRAVIMRGATNKEDRSRKQSHHRNSHTIADSAAVHRAQA